MNKSITNNRSLKLKLEPLTLAVLTALAAAPAVCHATTPVAPGQPLDANEFLVNAGITTLGQYDPKIARDAAGDFVVVWQGGESVGTQTAYEIFGRRYNTRGQAQGSAFLINTFISSNHAAPAVAMDAAGDFVVAWASYNPAATDNERDIYVRQYNSSGTAVQASGFLVNTVTTGGQGDPAVAMDAAGDFVVAWDSYDQAATNSFYDIYARQFHADGSAVQASEFLVNLVTSYDQLSPVVAMDAAGDFVIGWAGYDHLTVVTNGINTFTEIYAGIFARRYNAAGQPQGSAFLLNTDTTGHMDDPSVAMDAAGDFVMAWQSQYQADNNAYGIYARQYLADGSAMQASGFLVNTFTSGNQGGPAVAMDAAGDFVVAWTSYGQAATNSAADIYARQYDADGSAVQASEFLINTFTSNFQSAPTVAMDAAGDFVATYAYSNFPLSNEFAIYARRYQGPEQVDLKAGLAASPTTVAVSGSVSLTASLDNDTTSSTLVPASVPGGDVINAALGIPTLPQAAITLPSGVSFTSATGTNWSCPGAPAGSVLTCSYTASLAAGAAATPLTVKVTAPASAGTATFSAAVSSLQEDSQSSDNTASAAVTVVSGIPAASNGSVSTKENTAGSGTLSAADADGDTLTFTIVSKPSHGTATITNAATGAFSYTPTSGYSGSDSFSFKATDSAGNASNTATESVTITAASGGGSGGGGSGGSGGSGTSGGSSGGGGGFGLLSLALLGLPLLRKRQRRTERQG